MNNKIKLISFICLIVSHIMCINVTWIWCEYANNPANSAPAWINIIYAIPYLVIIIVLLVIRYFINKKQEG